MFRARRFSDEFLFSVPDECERVSCEFYEDCRSIVGLTFPFPHGRASTLPLSEAIHLGSGLDSQAKDMILEEGASSALGATLVAVYGDLAENYAMTPTGETFPISDRPAGCPIPGWGYPVGVMVPGPMIGEQNNVGGICDHLEEAHGWTRWQVADWVQSVDSEAKGSMKRGMPDPPSLSIVMRGDAGRLGLGAHRDGTNELARQPVAARGDENCWWGIGGR